MDTHFVCRIQKRIRIWAQDLQIRIRIQDIQKIAEGLEASPGARKFEDIRINKFIHQIKFFGTVNYQVYLHFKNYSFTMPCYRVKPIFWALKVELFKLRNGFSFGLPPVMRIRIRIRIHRIHMFVGLLDPDPDPLVRNMNPDSDPSIIKQKQLRKTLIPTVL